MNRKTRIIISTCVVVLVAIGALVYFYRFAPHTVNLGEVGSMAGLAKLPNLQCRIAEAADGATFQGVVYIYEGQLRADIIYAGEGTSTTPTLIHTLVATSGEAYRWDEGATQGIKLPFDFSANALTMSCSPWLDVDPTLFEMPPGVTFTQENSSAQ